MKRRVLKAAGVVGSETGVQLLGALIGMGLQVGMAIATEPAPLIAAPTSDTEFGFSVFQKRCTACHGNPAVARAPTPDQLRQFTPEKIYDALTTGAMKVVGDTLTDGERHQVSASLAGRPFGAGNVADKAVLNRCADNPAMRDPEEGASWNGWGANVANRRFQQSAQAGLTPDTVSKLTLKWVFGFPGSSSAYSQPTVASGRVFVGSDTGQVYSLDAKSGCVYWSFQSKAGVRSSITVARMRSHGRVRYGIFYGDLKANVYALDAQTGQLQWSASVDPLYTSRVTASPAVYAKMLYVPVSSWEEFAASSPGYPCCRSVGSVVALRRDTGRRSWKTYVIAHRPKPVRKNASGVQQWAPAGASVWNTPTLDPVHHRLYVGTGDATTYPAAPTSDAVLALDMKSGRILWTYQAFKHDSFLGSCPAVDKPENCPRVQGPDFDIPAPPMLLKTAESELLLVGTKPGDILALDPNAGRLVWRVNVFGEALNDSPTGSPDGQPRIARGVQWGGATDQQTAFYSLSGGGVAALRVTDGVQVWHSDLGVDSELKPNNGAPASLIPGVLFVGGSDGMLSAISTANGSMLWQYATKRSFDAVDNVETHGGSIYAGGAVIADGMVFVGSGYAVYAGTPGNALLAFGLE